MTTQKTAIGILAATALTLLLTLLLVPKPATGQVAIKDKDYVLCTYPGVGGNDVIYVGDTNGGMFAAIVYDASAKRLQVRAVRPIEDAFITR